MTVKEALQELANSIKQIIEQRIMEYGVNPKTNKNTLHGSDLEKSIKVRPIEYGIELEIADYWEHISLGRKPSPSSFNILVNKVLQWVKEKHIAAKGKTQNDIAWAIAKSIAEQGIRPRPFLVYDEEGDLTRMIPQLSQLMDEWFDELFDIITLQLDKYFEK